MKQSINIESLRFSGKTYEELTPEEKLFADEEGRKCNADPVYFYANYWIVDGKLPDERQIKIFKRNIKKFPHLFQQKA